MDAWRRENGARWAGGKFASVWVTSRPDASSWLKYHARQSSANFSSSLRETPRGVIDRFREVGGGVGPGRPFLRPLGLLLNEGEDGGITPDFAAGLPGGETTEVE